MPTLSELRTLLQLSIPSSLQQLIFAMSIMVLFSIIAQLGTDELAISQVLINLALLLILPAVGLGMAATTLVSQALGNQDTNLAASIGWDVVKVATLILMILSTPLWLIPDAILGLFIHDLDIVDKARLPLQITGLAICLDTAAIIFTHALLGAGANRTVMLISTLGQWFFYLPLAWIIGPYLGGGLLGIWLVQLLHRGLSSVVFAYIWSLKRWVHIRL
jgi:Na+-driven multidrug efflux pump